MSALSVRYYDKGAYKYTSFTFTFTFYSSRRNSLFYYNLVSLHFWVTTASYFRVHKIKWIIY